MIGLCSFDGDSDYKGTADAIAKALREYTVVDDLNPLRSHDRFLHHMQYKWCCCIRGWYKLTFVCLAHV